MHINKPKLRCRLYLITPPQIVPEKFKNDLAIALDSGDISCVQLRLKNASDDQIMRAAEILLPIVKQRKVAFLMNDNPKLALKCGCDGVHIGQDDSSYEDAREILGPDSIIGVTCKDNRHLAFEASEKGADYVAFGSFFPSNTKKVLHKPSPEIINIWTTTTTVPCVAIGGINHENCSPLIRAGADFLAVISAIWNHKLGPGAAVKSFNQVIKENC